MFARCSLPITIALLTPLAAGGCSATSYKPAIDGFANASGKASEAYMALETNVLSAQTERLKRLALAGKAQVRPFEQDCTFKANHCRLEVMEKGGKAQLLPPPNFGKISLLLNGITKYATNLQAIVNSQTAQQVSASLIAAGGSIKDLASMAPGSVADISAFAVPSANLAAWVAGQYVNQLQVSALRNATRAADPVIQKSAARLKDIAASAKDPALADATDAVEADQAAYQAAPRDRSKLEQLMQTAAVDDALLAAPAASVFSDMGEAHGKLTRSLQGQDVTLAEALAAVESFAAEATQLQGLVNTLSKVQPTIAAK